MTARILVVRPIDEFSRILSAHGFPVISCPAIETVESENLRDWGAKILAKSYDGIFLTSRKATEIAARDFFCKNFKYAGRVYVLGKSSYERLTGKNLDLFFDERWNTARELLAAIPSEDLRGKRFLFIRGEKSLGAIREFLTPIAALDEEIVYETRRLAIADDLKSAIEARAKAGEIRAACFFSPSGAESFLEQFDEEVLHQTGIATIGKTTADFFAGRGLKVDFTPRKATAEDFAFELVNYLKNR